MKEAKSIYKEEAKRNKSKQRHHLNSSLTVRKFWLAYNRKYHRRKSNKSIAF